MTSPITLPNSASSQLSKFSQIIRKFSIEILDTCGHITEVIKKSRKVQKYLFLVLFLTLLDSTSITMKTCSSCLYLYYSTTSLYLRNWLLTPVSKWPWLALCQIITIKTSSYLESKIKMRLTRIVVLINNCISRSQTGPEKCLLLV